MGQYGTLSLSQEQSEVLAAPVDPAEVEIRPDGIVFAPWTSYADRLDAAFGQTGWRLVPDGKPLMQDGFVIWGFALFCQGQFVSYALGEHPDPLNSKMSLANRSEAAKSDALVKCSKALSVCRDLWRPSFLEEWKEQYAVKVWALQTEYSQKGRWLWRRKDRPPFFKERPPKDSMETEYSKAQRMEDDARDHIDSIQHES